MIEIGNWMQRRTKGSRAAVATTARRVAVEALEGRTLLSSTIPGIGAIHPTPNDAVFAYPAPHFSGPTTTTSGGSFSSATDNETPIAGAMSPSQLRQAYGINNIILPDGSPATGAGVTIAIVCGGHDTTIQNDLHVFDQQYFGGVDPSFTQVNLGTNAQAGNAIETAIDVEWSHAMAPQANIILVEAASMLGSDLFAGVDKAVSLGAQVVSMSWGGQDYSTETNNDVHFTAPDVAFVAASGDGGAPGWYPAASPGVLGVGGTTVSLDANNNWSSEVGWAGSSGGVSAYEPRPAYQPATYTNGATSGIALTKRGVPDVAYDGALVSGVSVYNSYDAANPSRFYGTLFGWGRSYGTSIGAPQWAGLLALADQGRAELGLAPLGSVQALTTLYANPDDFHDITGGTSTGSPNYTAGTRYDLVTGLGTPQAPLVVSSLIGAAPTSAPSAPTGLSATPADKKVSLLWNASSNATTWNVYRSTDGLSYALDATVGGTNFVDNGLTDGTSYYYDVTAVDSVGESPASAAVVSKPQVPPSPPTSPTAVGSYSTYGGNTCFAMTIGWTASAGATTYNVLQSSINGSSYALIASGVSGTSYTDSTVSAGTKYYYVIQAVSPGGAVSANSAQVTGTALPTAPTNVTATSGNLQTALAWSASSGATTYNVLRSTTNGSGYVLIASGVTGTSYTDTKLTVGVTYYYVIQAVDAGGPSANSNQVSTTAKHGK